MKRIFLFVTVAMALVVSKANSVYTDSAAICEQMMDKYVNLILPEKINPDFVKMVSTLTNEEQISDHMVKELFEKVPVSNKTIQRLLQNFKADGTWSDIDYNGQKRSQWEPCTHADRVLSLCFYYRSHPENKEVKDAIHKAFGAWFRMQLKCPNWWYNEIGVPMTLGKAALCFRHEMSPQELADLTTVMNVCHFGRTGQNRVWQAGNVLIKALLNHEISIALKAQTEITAEITIGNKEGIQVDGSFCQHGRQQQFGNYGAAFLAQMAFYANLFHNTPMAFSEQQLGLLTKLLLEGYRYEIYGQRLEVNALDRQIGHNAALHKGYSVLLSALQMYNGCAEKDKKPLSNFIQDMLSAKQGTNFAANKYFDVVKQTVYRTPSWMTSIKMASKDVIGTENVNKDHMKGFYMADGAQYVYVWGDEYDNVFPLWDFRKVPGITCYNTTLPLPRADEKYGKARLMNNTNKVNSIEKNGNRLTMMELNRDGIRARKAWICTPDAIICIGAGIETDSLLNLTSALEQKQPKGDIYILEGEKTSLLQGQSKYTKRLPKVYCDSICYIPLIGDTLVAEHKERTGDWHECVDFYHSKQVKGNMFTLYIAHKKKASSMYAYAILPAISMEKAQKFNTSQIQILQNTPEKQTVMYRGHIYEIDWINEKLNITAIQYHVSK